MKYLVKRLKFNSFLLAFLAGHMLFSQSTIAERIIARTVVYHGSEKLNDSRVKFDLFDAHFDILHENGRFSYKWYKENTEGGVEKVKINNKGVFTFQNENWQKLESQDTVMYIMNINGGRFLTLLPHTLNRKSALKKYLGKSTIGNQDYHKIEITYQKDTGGFGHENRFIYWIKTNLNEPYIDFIAINFPNPFGDGYAQQFLERKSTRTINGIKFNTYDQYSGHPDIGTEIEKFEKYFTEDKLSYQFRFQPNNISVEPF